MMLERFFSDPKRMVLIVGAGVVTLFVCLVLITGLGWMTFREKETPEPTIEPVSIGYCGADLTELCVVSFSQNVFGDTRVNLYVPVKRYPIFYLNIIRHSSISRFECEWEKELRTSVHCTGAPINLGEGFEIQVLSTNGDQLIAQGPFTLTAFLVTTQTADEEPAASTSPKLETTEEATPTPTKTPTKIPTGTPTETSTEQPEVTVSATP